VAAGCSVDGDHGAGQVQLGHQRGELARAMLGRGAEAILRQNAVVVVAARSRAVPSRSAELEFSSFAVATVGPDSPPRDVRRLHARAYSRFHCSRTGG
jgi:hypothetical protein